MKILRKVKTILSLDFKYSFLFIEAFFYLGLARILKNVQFVKIAPSLGVEMNETSHKQTNDIKELHKISMAIDIMSRHTWWESKCLVKAIAGMRMLERRKIESTLYMGIARKDGKMTAHAWLRSGSFYVSGAEGMEQYTVVSKFAKRIDEVKVK